MTTECILKENGGCSGAVKEGKFPLCENHVYSDCSFMSNGKVECLLSDDGYDFSEIVIVDPPKKGGKPKRYKSKKKSRKGKRKLSRKGGGRKRKSNYRKK